MIERRKTPRVEIRQEEICRLELRQRVQLLDISQSGALLGSEGNVPVGSTGQFRAGLAALPFHAEVHIRRHHARAIAKKQVSLGAQFAAMDDRSKNSLEAFLKRGKD